MKKKVISTVLCAAMVASMFAGCGNKAADNSSAADNSAAESSDAAATTEAGDTAAETEAASASDDAIANLITSPSVLYLRQMQKISFLRISMQQQMYSYLQMIR